MGTRDLFVRAAKQGFVAVSTETTMAILVAQFPYLFFHPFVFKFIRYHIRKHNEKLADHADLSVFFRYIDTRVNGQGTEWASEALKNLAVQESPTATDEEKRRAEEEFFVIHKRLVKFNS